MTPDPWADFLTDRCVIRDVGTGALDRDTGRLTRTAGSIRYEGPCNLQVRPSVVTGEDQGSTIDEHELRLPEGVQGLAKGQVVTVEGEEPTDWVVHRLHTQTMGMLTRVIVRRRTATMVVDS